MMPYSTAYLTIVEQ